LPRLFAKNQEGSDPFGRSDVNSRLPLVVLSGSAAASATAGQDACLLRTRLVDDMAERRSTAMCIREVGDEVRKCLHGFIAAPHSGGAGPLVEVVQDLVEGHARSLAITSPFVREQDFCSSS
jgi:hypothetical protein